MISQNMVISTYEGAPGCAEAIKYIRPQRSVSQIELCSQLQAWCNSSKDTVPIPEKKFTAEPLTPEFHDQVYLMVTTPTVSPQDHLIDLLIDDGLPGRPNRKILLNPKASKFGVALKYVDGRAALLLAVEIDESKLDVPVAAPILETLPPQQLHPAFHQILHQPAQPQPPQQKAQEQQRRPKKDTPEPTVVPKPSTHQPTNPTYPSYPSHQQQQQQQQQQQRKKQPVTATKQAIDPKHPVEYERKHPVAPVAAVVDRGVAVADDTTSAAGGGKGRDAKDVGMTTGGQTGLAKSGSLYNYQGFEDKTPVPASTAGGGGRHRKTASGAGLTKSNSNAQYAAKKTHGLNDSGMSTATPSVTNSRRAPNGTKGAKDEVGMHYIVEDLKLFLEYWSDAWHFESYSVNKDTEPTKLMYQAKLLPLSRCQRVYLDVIPQTNDTLLKADISGAPNFISFKINPLAKSGSMVRLSSSKLPKRQALFRKRFIGHIWELEGNILTIIFHHSKAEITAYFDQDSAVELFADERPFNRVESFGQQIEKMYRNNKLIRYLINHCYGNPEYYKQDTLDGMGKQLENYLEDPVYKLAQGLAEKGAAYSNVKHSYPAIAGLDPSQLKAFMGAYSAANYYIVQGAPGTGKTKVAKALVSIYSKQNKKVLVVSYHNISLDKIIAEMDAEGLLSPQTAAFYGSPSTSLNLKYFIPGLKAGLYPTHNPSRSDEQRKKLLKDQLKQKTAVFVNFADAGSKLFEALVGDYSDSSLQQKFDAVILEDAGHLPFLQSLLVAGLGKKLILLGDYNQPVVRSGYYSEADVMQVQLAEILSGSRKIAGTSYKSLLDAILNRFDPSVEAARALLRKKRITIHENPKHSSHVAALLVNFV